MDMYNQSRHDRRSCSLSLSQHVFFHDSECGTGNFTGDRVVQVIKIIAVVLDKFFALAFAHEGLVQ